MVWLMWHWQCLLWFWMPEELRHLSIKAVLIIASFFVYFGQGVIFFYFGQEVIFFYKVIFYHEVLLVQRPVFKQPIICDKCSVSCTFLDSPLQFYFYQRF
jgi:hypothetical protein